MAIRKIKVLVVLEGGIVQDVLTDVDGVEVLIKDLDIEGTDPEDVFTDPYGDEVYYRFPHVEGLVPDTVNAEFKAAEEQEAEEA